MLLLKSGCVKEAEICSNDFVIIDKNKTYLCERKNNNLEIIGTIKTDKDNREGIY